MQSASQPVLRRRKPRHMNIWEIATNYYQYFLRGTRTTILISLLTVFCGSILGCLIAFMLSRWKSSPASISPSSAVRRCSCSSTSFATSSTLSATPHRNPLRRRSGAGAAVYHRAFDQLLRLRRRDHPRGHSGGGQGTDGRRALVRHDECAGHALRGDAAGGQKYSPRHRQ